MKSWITGCAQLLAGASALAWAGACRSEQPHAAPNGERPVARAPVAPEQPSNALIEVADEDAPANDARSLYLRNCAGCHNDNGDGRGPTMLAQNTQARSFAQGGFAFGNTKEAVFKTITAGFPGLSAMPSFKATMNDDERRLVAEYVLTLTPYSHESARGTKLVAGEEGAMARGKLPPIASGKPERPRGLLLGTADGMSFEFRTDDVRLLGVRMGGFADRHDWNERGGDYLEPLGKLLCINAAGDPGPTFQRTDDQRPLGARLESSWARGNRVGLSYVLLDEQGT